MKTTKAHICAACYQLVLNHPALDARQLMKLFCPTCRTKTGTALAIAGIKR